MLEGRTVLVTGGGRGIGAAVGRALAAAGARVWVAGRDLAGCERVAQEFGGRAFALDVTDPDSVAAAREAVGALDGLVNNAGIAESAPLLPRDPAAQDALFERQFAVNLHGVRRMTEAFAPGMIERGRGAIVNVVSSAGFVGYAYTAGYTASKHAALGYTRVAHLELAKKGVRVHAICPHFVDSPMTDESVARIVARTGRGEDEARALLAAGNPGRRLVTPEEVAACVVDLLGRPSGGRLVELDGGPAPLERDL
ncbi:MAG TPA: SDR family NAD(P)-dependent oxidoreductase [Planctomycetota bacterium]|nr:SDR family NAD(P)-dependent oxidoreductase [Planctomycetota bacterium]